MKVILYKNIVHIKITTLVFENIDTINIFEVEREVFDIIIRLLIVIMLISQAAYSDFA